MKSHVRIIGGRWRGTRLAVVDAPGLRPTPDRIRETLFNWLDRDCRGATVLDCFAGSGVLGLEALSRGGSSLVAIEQQRRAAEALRQAAQRLQSGAVEVIAGDALRAVERLDRRFDIVFIDPPYAQAELRARVFERLETRGLLNDGASIYFEWAHSETFELPSPALQWSKQKSAGQVHYAIAEWRRSR